MAVVIVALILIPAKRLFGNRESLFLLILTFCGLGAAFLFDPKLGMPRDWDLFSFSSVAVVVLAYYTLLKRRSKSHSNTMIVVMAIFLGFAVLIPRAVGRSTGTIELPHIENYFRLDVKKNIYHYLPVQDYYYKNGQREKALAIFARWERICPEWEFNKRGVELERRERYAEAVPYFRRAIELNAMFAPAYSNLGSCYLSLRQMDSAEVYLNISNGLNPNSAHILMKLAYLYYWKRDFDTAEKYFKQSIDCKSDLITNMGLLELYSQTNQKEKYLSLLEEIAARPDAMAEVHQQLGDLYLSRNRVKQARTQYRMAIDKGIDSTQVRVIRERFPDLSP